MAAVEQEMVILPGWDHACILNKPKKKLVTARRTNERQSIKHAENSPKKITTSRVNCFMNHSISWCCIVRMRRALQSGAVSRYVYKSEIDILMQICYYKDMKCDQ